MVERFGPRANPDNSLVKETRDHVYMAANILLLYGPKTRTTANAEKTRPIRNWIQVRKANGTVPLYGSKTRMPLSARRLARNEIGFRFVWSLSNGKGSYRPVARMNVERFIGKERG